MACPTTWPNASPARSERAGTGFAHKPRSSFTAQVPYIELPDMPPAVQALLAGVPPLNVVKAMANSEAVVTGMVQLGEALRSNAALDKQL
jgi:hypothetical protein